MGNLSGFRADEHESKPVGPVPEGSYECQIVESAVADSKSGNGKNLKLVLEITEGEFSGRRLYDNIVVKHATSEKAVEIGLAKLGDICRAVDVLSPEDSDQLHGKPLVAVVEHETSTWNGETRTNARVHYYKPAEKVPF